MFTVPPEFHKWYGIYVPDVEQLCEHLSLAKLFAIKDKYQSIKLVHVVRIDIEEHTLFVSCRNLAGEFQYEHPISGVKGFRIGFLIDPKKFLEPLGYWGGNILIADPASQREGKIVRYTDLCWEPNLAELLWWRVTLTGRPRRPL